MLIDTAEITVHGGHGGAGMPKKHKGPDGGNGGNGGDVYIKGSSNIKLLNQFIQKDIYFAGDGGMGARNNKTGKQGKDIEILLPVGTSIYDKKTREFILDVNKIGDRVLICNGGRGGWGGLTAEQGVRGEEKKLVLSLRLIAYFGLIGLPNVGKSSLLNEIQNTLKDYKTVRKELSEFKLELTKKPEVVILTKTDLVDPSYIMKLTKELNKVNKKVIPVSIHNYQSLEELKKVLRNI